MPPAIPSYITPASLVHAKKTELQYWILKANEDAEQKVINKSAKRMEVLRDRLATYYGIDISQESVLRQVDEDSTSKRAIGPVEINHAITQDQWAYLRGLGCEWREKIEKNEEFILLHRPVDLAGECLVVGVLQTSDGG